MKRNLFAFIFLFSTFSLSFAAIPQSEKEALYAISTSVKNAYNWKEEIPVEQWSGVTITNVDGADHVTGLEMSVTKNGDNYTIDFSSRIADLTFLENFKLRYRFSTPINFNFDFIHIVGLNRLVNLEVARVWTFTNNDLIKNADQLPLLVNLENLTLQFDSPTFKIPTNIASNLKLKKLFYQNFQDQTYAPEIFNALSLEDLTLQTNVYNLDPSTKAVMNMTKLKNLTLQGNFNSLPVGFYAIPNLEIFSINAPNFTLSAAIGNYTALKSFQLQTSGILNLYVIGTMVGLENLSITSFSNSIYLPSSISNLKELKSLYVSDYNSVFIPAEIAQLTNLESLFYYSRGATDEVIYTIPNLKKLIISTNQNISDKIKNLSKLEQLQVQSRQNFTELPQSIGTMTTLKKVDFLKENGTPTKTFSIPANYFMNWPKLEQFWTQHNLDGNITNQFLNNPLLEYLILNPSDGTSELLEGKLNLCQNPKLYAVTINRNNISEVDLRGIEGLPTGATTFFYFQGGKVSKFIVDDVAHFNNLITAGKIKIQTNAPGGYTVVSSSEPCQKPLAASNVASQKILLYPNPVKDILNFKTEKTVEDVEVYSATGQKLNVDFYRNKADLSSLPAGVYMIKWSEGGVFKINKIIKE